MPAPMDGLYSRLSRIGYDRAFVRDVMLPDWWEDSLAQNPTNLAIAEISIAKFTGIPVSVLRDPDRELQHPEDFDVRLKRSVTALNDARLCATVIAAARLAEATADLLEHRSFPVFDRCRPSASTLRREILSFHPNTYVDLRTLLDHSWKHGVPVVWMARRPRQGRAIDGFSMFVGNRPVIVLASNRQPPAWLAYHLAHELGHIYQEHVSPSSGPIADRSLRDPTEDPQEVEADRFACELLTGDPEPRFISQRPLSGATLARAATVFGEENRISPGSVALFYGKTLGRWGVAANALKELGADGAPGIIMQEFRRHVPLDDLSEREERLLGQALDAA